MTHNHDAVVGRSSWNPLSLFNCAKAWVIVTYRNAPGHQKLVRKRHIPAMDSPNEPDTEKGITSTTTQRGRREVKGGTVSPKANCCLSALLCDKMMPNKRNWRRMACTILIVALLAVTNLSVCSVPAMLYLLVPVSV